MFNLERLRDFGKGKQVDEASSIVEPAFRSSTQALVFLLFVSLCLVLPVLLDRTGAVTREQSYELMPEQHGAYTFMQEQIFETGDDIDILFIGSSVLWNAVDTTAVQKALSDELGRPAKVVTFGFNFNGIDIPYTILNDLLEHRRVRLVIFSIPRLSLTTGPSTTSYKFLRYSENSDVVAGLTLSSKISLYACNVLRSPHDLLAIVREDRSRRSRYADDLGANKELLGMYRDPDTFVRFTPTPPDFAASDLIYSDTTRDRFEFTNYELTPHQDHYLNHFVELLNEKRIPLAMLNVPQYSERGSDRVLERYDWSKRFGHDVPLIGVPSTVLFGGLDEKQVEMLHCDREHLNKNGNEYFTHAILPAILMTYQKHASKQSDGCYLRSARTKATSFVTPATVQ